MPTAIDQLSSLRSSLQTLLTNQLGVYDFNGNGRVVGSKPAIWVLPPQLPPNVKMRPGSGVECLIYRTPKIETKSMFGSRKSICKEWIVILRQHKLNDSLAESLERIACVFSGAKITVREQMQVDGDVALEQAKIIIPGYNLS